MNKSLLYIATAIVLGIAVMLIPTWIFLVKAGQEERLTEAFARAFSGGEGIRPPLQDFEQNHLEAVSSREVEVLGVTFVAALIVYTLFKRRPRKNEYIWPLLRTF